MSDRRLHLGLLAVLLTAMVVAVLRTVKTTEEVRRPAIRTAPGPVRDEDRARAGIPTVQLPERTVDVPLAPDSELDIALRFEDESGLPVSGVTVFVASDADDRPSDSASRLLQLPLPREDADRIFVATREGFVPTSFELQPIDLRQGSKVVVLRRGDVLRGRLLAHPGHGPVDFLGVGVYALPAGLGTGLEAAAILRDDPRLPRATCDPAGSFEFAAVDPELRLFAFGQGWVSELLLGDSEDPDPRLEASLAGGPTGERFLPVCRPTGLVLRAVTAREGRQPPGLARLNLGHGQAGGRWRVEVRGELRAAQLDPLASRLVLPVHESEFATCSVFDEVTDKSGSIAAEIELPGFEPARAAFPVPPAEGGVALRGVEVVSDGTRWGHLTVKTFREGELVEDSDVRGIPGKFMRLYGEGRTLCYWFDTEPDGVVELDVPWGQYKPRLHSLQGSTLATPRAELVTIGAQPEVLEFDLVVGGAITVTFPEGANPESVAIDLIRLDGAQQMIGFDRRLDAAPPWDFRDIPSGTYRVLIDAESLLPSDPIVNPNRRPEEAPVLEVGEGRACTIAWRTE